jgi:hypothetical protein
MKTAVCHIQTLPAARIAVSGSHPCIITLHQRQAVWKGTLRVQRPAHAVFDYLLAALRHLKSIQ